MINSQGQGLPYPSTPFPVTVSSLNNPQINGTNEITLPPGGTVIVPAGYQVVDPGQYSWVQFVDPVSNIWRGFATDNPRGLQYVNSDGFNFRVANPTGCVVGLHLTGGGAGYTAATPPAVSFSSGGALATAVVGGALGALTITALGSLTVTSGAGSNFTYQPIVSISAPPVGGVQAAAVATISGGALNGFTITQQGAGYTTAPTVRVIPNPADPATNITAANVVATLTGSTSVTAILVTNYGNGVLGGVPAATIAAPTAGTTATGVPIVALSATAFAITQGGSGYGNPTLITTAGGQFSGGAFTNPFIDTALYLPRPATFQAQVSTGGSGGSVTASGAQLIDGGLFQNAPSFLPFTSGPITTAATGTFTLGGQNDTVMVQSIGGNG